MNYTAYLKRTQEAAEALGGEYVSLAGGFYGVMLPVDGMYLMFSLDLDGSSGWAVWMEDIDNERCCDFNTMELGWLPLDQLLPKALEACAAHGYHFP